MNPHRPSPSLLSTFAIALITTFLLPQLRADDTSAATIEACSYSDDQAAQKAWRAQSSSPAAVMRDLDGEKTLTLQCDFSTNPGDRAAWDMKMEPTDFTQFEAIALDLRCENFAPINSISLYLQTPTGWHNSSVSLKKNHEWETVVIRRSNMKAEGNPGGWDNIIGLRLAAWKGDDKDTTIYVRNLRKVGVLGVDTKILLVNSAANQEDNHSYVELTSNLFKRVGIRHAILNDTELHPELLAKANLVILPYNPDLPDSTEDMLADYLQKGGKLIACYHMPKKLSSVTGIPRGTYLVPEPANQFLTMRPVDNLLPGAPPSTIQGSWNISAVTNPGDRAKAVANWFDGEEKDTGIPAIIASDNALFVSHILTPDDLTTKSQLLMAMAGLLRPEIWSEALESRNKNLTQVVERASLVSPDFQPTQETTDEIAKRQSAAKNLEAKALAAANAKDYQNALAAIDEAIQNYREIYFLRQKPKDKEFRAFWCHSAYGVKGMTWDEAIKRLKDNGFNAIFTNMLWGGVAFYPSDVLPVASDIAEKGDQLAECLAACRKYGVEIHVWKVNWNLGHAVPPSHVDAMRAAHRLQQSFEGEEQPWLCPSNPDNQKLELDSLTELVRKYSVDGIHFDYIRYPNPSYCFCDPCRQRFEASTGKPVTDWPTDVRPKGDRREEWITFCQNNITGVVKSVSEEARKIRPEVKISAAVFRNWDTDSRSVMQDWKLWCERGYLDFVCPMNYTTSTSTFNRWIAKQKEWAGPAKLLPGIGASATGISQTAEDVIEQIEITRKHNTDGFLIFNYGLREANEILPMLGLGETKR